MVKDLKQEIISSYESVTPDILDRIKTSCSNEVQDENIVKFQNEREINKRTILVKTILVAAAMLVTCIAGFKVGNVQRHVPIATGPSVTLEDANTNNIEDNVVVNELSDSYEVLACLYIDVNPSIRLEIGENNTVVGCKAINDDANSIIQNMSLEGLDVSMAMNTLIGSLYVHGYLQEDTAALLVSVESDDSDVYAQIEKDVTKVFVEMETSVEVILQRVDSEKYADLAEQYNVSIGKIAYIETIIEGNPEYTMDDIERMIDMPIRRLYDISSDEIKSEEEQDSAIDNNAVKNKKQSPTKNQEVTQKETVNNVVVENQSTQTIPTVSASETVTNADESSIVAADISEPSYPEERDNKVEDKTEEKSEVTFTPVENTTHNTEDLAPGTTQAPANTIETVFKEPTEDDTDVTPPAPGTVDTDYQETEKEEEIIKEPVTTTDEVDDTQDVDKAEGEPAKLPEEGASESDMTLDGEKDLPVQTPEEVVEESTPSKEDETEATDDTPSNENTSNTMKPEVEKTPEEDSSSEHSGHRIWIVIIINGIRYEITWP